MQVDFWEVQLVEGVENHPFLSFEEICLQETAEIFIQSKSN